jgi:hypothetical protein
VSGASLIFSSSLGDDGVGLICSLLFPSRFSALLLARALTASGGRSHPDFLSAKEEFSVQQRESLLSPYLLSLHLLPHARRCKYEAANTIKKKS